jgi:hypothetical protein
MHVRINLLIRDPANLSHKLFCFACEETTHSRRPFLKSSMALAIFIVPRFVLGGKECIAPSDKITLGVIGISKQNGGLCHSFIKTGEEVILFAYQEKAYLRCRDRPPDSRRLQYR